MILALNKEEEKTDKVIETIEVAATEGPNVVTTNEEMEAYHIVRSILRKKVAVNRIVHRDVQSYFGILLDDNNRKPLCRLYLNGIKKYIGVFDSQKKESRFELTTLDDIYQYDKQLLDTLSSYLVPNGQGE